MRKGEGMTTTRANASARLIANSHQPRPSDRTRALGRPQLSRSLRHPPPSQIPRAPPDACMHAETTVSDTYACTVPGHDVSVCRYGLRPVLRVCVCVARAPPHCAECPLPMGSVTSPAGGCVPRSGYVDVRCAARARTTYAVRGSAFVPALAAVGSAGADCRYKMSNTTPYRLYDSI